MIFSTDMILALQWARIHLRPASFAHVIFFGSAVVRVVCAAVDCFDDARVCDYIAEILVENAPRGLGKLELRRKLASNREARTAIARAVSRVREAHKFAPFLVSYGLVEVGDIALLLDELDTAPNSDAVRTVAYVIAQTLYGVPWFDIALIERTLAKAATNTALDAALKPVLAAVDLSSSTSKAQKASYERLRGLDLPSLLSSLDTPPNLDTEKAIACQIGHKLSGAPRSDTALIERVLAKAATNPILDGILKPVIAPVALSSEKANEQKASYQRQPQRKDRTAESSEPASDPANLIGTIDSSSVMAFVTICDRLAGTSWCPDEEVLPGWGKVQPALQSQINRSAQMYLNGYCVANTTWIGKGETWHEVTCGNWALRVLTQVDPPGLDSLSADVWYAWMPSVLGVHTRQDQVQVTILRTAYQRHPARFRELVGLFIDKQSRWAGAVLIGDRLKPVWDSEIAKLLRTRLKDDRLSSPAFFRILSILMQAGDAGVGEIAAELLAGSANAPLEKIRKPVELALRLLERNPSEAWAIVWPVANENLAFAKQLIGELAANPYGTRTTHILSGLREDQVADLGGWIDRYWAEREGDQARAIGYLGGFSLDRLKEVAEQIVRQKTWTPRSTSNVLSLVLDGVWKEEATDAPDKPGPPPVASAPAESKIRPGPSGTGIA